MKIAARNQIFFGSELSTVPASFGIERRLKWDGNISNYSENCQISLHALQMRWHMLQIALPQTQF